MRKKVIHKTVLLACLLAGLLFMQCDQEPLFWVIANEYPPEPPIIGGAPSKIVAIIGSPSPWEGKLYIANRDSVWEYATATKLWRLLPSQPSGKTKDLAVADNKLFALGMDNKIRMYDGTNWNTEITVPGGTTIEKIFGVDTWLFAGVKSSTGDYSILSLSVPAGVPSSTWTPLTGPDALLMGVARKGLNDYYLGTLGDGLYSSNGSTASAVAGFEDEEIIGLAVHGSDLFTVHPKKIRRMGVTAPIAIGNFTGAITVWNASNDPLLGDPLLLVGLLRSSGSFGYGYREIVISDPAKGLLNPGRDDIAFSTSVKRGSQYISAIGKHVVYHLWVLEDSTADDEGRPIIFASTSKEGLWSYRKRGTEPQWNGENND